MPNTEIVNDRLRSLEIDQDAIKELRTARGFLEPELDNMLEKFYSQILDEPLIRSVFRTKNPSGEPGTRKRSIGFVRFWEENSTAHTSIKRNGSVAPMHAVG